MSKGVPMRWWPWSKPKPITRKLSRPVERHLGINLDEAQSITHESKPVEQVNIQKVIDRWCAESNPGSETIGFSATGYLRDGGLVKHLITDELIQAPLERTQLESGPNETLDCVTRG